MGYWSLERGETTLGRRVNNATRTPIVQSRAFPASRNNGTKGPKRQIVGCAHRCRFIFMILMQHWTTKSENQVRVFVCCIEARGSPVTISSEEIRYSFASLEIVQTIGCLRRAPQTDSSTETADCLDDFETIRLHSVLVADLISPSTKSRQCTSFEGI